MILPFFKYQGAGNDFILVDNRNGEFNDISQLQIKKLCNRNFGVGADGLMLLNKHEHLDFEMDYYNSDGSGGAMCGNGGRCIVAFAKQLKIINEQTKFIASDGRHEAFIDDSGIVKLKMIDVETLEEKQGSFFVDTGAPHHVEFDAHIKELDVYEKGKQIRYSDEYRAVGTNVNFVQVHKNGIQIRTYERGVENETLACGTGAVASAISYYKKYDSGSENIKVKTLGGELYVSFKEKANIFTDVYLSGPAIFVFRGKIDI